MRAAARGANVEWKLIRHHQPAGIERVTQQGARTPLSDEKNAMNIDASLDGKHVVSGESSLFVASGS
jgi:hypothetical protein